MIRGGQLIRHAFTLEYWQDESWFVGRLREISGVFSQGETLSGLEENIRDAYDLALADGLASPAPTAGLRKDIEIKRIEIEV